MAKWLLMAAVVVLMGVAHATGSLEILTDAERLTDLLRRAGAWGYAIYVGAFVLFEPMGIPAIAFIVPAGLIWPKTAALGLSLVGAMGASIVGFGFARFIARDWVAARLPQRLRVYDARLAQSGLKTVIVIRLLFFLLPASHWVLGLSRVSFGAYVVGTAIGTLPGIVLVTYVGGSLAGWLLGQPLWVWAIAGALAIGFGIGRRRFRRAGTTPPQ